MASVDVICEIEIARPVDVVAGYATDPDNAPEWYDNIRSVEWRTEPPVQVGSVFAFVARFLGRTLAYDYEVVELEADVAAGAVGVGEIPKSFGLSIKKPDGSRLKLDDPELDPIWDACARLGLPGLVKEDGSPRYPGGFADYIANHERAPGVGMLAGWRGENGEQNGAGAANPK